MAPDIEELIKKVNTLTLDKNRLRQKLTQLGNNGNQASPKETSILLNQSSLSGSQSSNQLLHQSSSELSCDPISKSSKNSINNRSLPGESLANSGVVLSSNLITGVECTTSCEEDLLYMNDLYKKRLDEYNENWEYIQSKCTALLSELNALQKHYILLKKEKLDLEDKFLTKSGECDRIKNELQTVVLNYETQLSAMSEHLSLITSQVNLGDNLTRVLPH